MRDVGVGLAGAGGWGRVLSEAAGRARGIKIVGCYDVKLDESEKLALQFGYRAFDSYSDMLQDSDVEGVIVAVPNSEHRNVVLEAAGHKKHVLVEKPLADSLDDAGSIIGGCSKAGVILAVGHNTRRYAGIRTMKRLVEEGAIGKVIMAEANFSHGRGLRLSPDEWRWYREECPGGPLMQLGVHHADILLYLLGPVKRVSAMFARVATPAEIEDTTLAMLEFSSGVLAYIGSNYASMPSTFYVTLYGTQGKLLFQPRRLLREDEGEPPQAKEIDLPKDDTLREELEEFAGCIVRGGQPEVGGREGYHALCVVLSAIKSNAENRPVTVDEIMADGPSWAVDPAIKAS